MRLAKTTQNANPGFAAAPAINHGRQLVPLSTINSQPSTINYQQRLFTGAFWSLLGAAANRGLYLLLSLFAARMLGKHAFGQFSLIQTTVGMIALFAGFGLGLACAKHVAELRHHQPARAGRLILLSGLWTALTGALGAAALLLSATWLAQRTSPDPALAGLFRSSSPMILFGALNGALTGILTGFESFKILALLNLVSGLLTLGFLAAGIHLGGIHGALWGLNLSLALTCVLNLAAIRRETNRWRIPCAGAGWTLELPLLWRFCLPILLASLLVTPVYWLAQAVLTRHFGFGAQAEYTVAAQWRTAVSWLPAMLTTAYLPVLSSLPAAQTNTHRGLVRSGLALSAAVGLAGALLIALAAQFILQAYGPAFRDCAWALRILAAAAVFDSVNDLINQTFLARGHPWLRLWANSFWAVLTVLGILFVVPKNGVVGLAIVLLITQALHLLFQVVLFRNAEAKAAAEEPLTTD